MKLVENLTAFFEVTSIHGLNYIWKASSPTNTIVRLTWLVLFLVSLTYAAIMISYEAKGNKYHQHSTLLFEKCVCEKN